MNQFRQIHASDLTASTLKDEIDAHGYLLIRELLPANNLSPLLADITHVVSAAGWLHPGHSPRERIAEVSAACGDSDPSFKQVYKEVFSLESLHAFPHHPELQQLMHLLAGPRLLIHPKPIVRLIFPNCEKFITQVHQDNKAIGGDAESFTAWIPLHDCPTELGPLRILETSHRFGLQTSASSGFLDTAGLRGGNWVTGQINAGDVLLFHSLTVHAGTPNLSNQLRISVDLRFQDCDRAVDPAALVFPGLSGNRRTWEATYANWRSDDLKYYWKKFALKLKPSKAELARLAETADSPDMRSRYAIILTQIEEQMLG